MSRNGATKRLMKAGDVITKHRGGVVDYDARCDCGWKKLECSAFYEAYDALRAHYVKVGTMQPDSNRLRWNYSGIKEPKL